MNNKNTILDLMIGHHALLEVLLTVLKDNLEKGSGAIRESLDEFRWQLEKHVFVEERVIFEPCRVRGSDICEVIKHLVEEHDTMMKMLNNMRDDMTKKDAAGITAFQELLKEHREVEERKLYPKLDIDLDKFQKEGIIKRINEIPLKDQNE